MAAAAAAAMESEETESLVTCSVCLCEYNTNVRKPKFLPCSHTLCLKCLKVFFFYFEIKTELANDWHIFRCRKSGKTFTLFVHCAEKVSTTRTTSTNCPTTPTLCTCSNWQIKSQSIQLIFFTFSENGQIGECWDFSISQSFQHFFVHFLLF